MAIKIVKVVEEAETPFGLSLQQQRMISQAQDRVNREHGIITRMPRVLVLVEQEYEDGS